MHINSLMMKIEDASLPMSQAVYTFPCTSFKVEVDMMEEKFFNWIKESDLVISSSCSYILEGVAHQVEFIISTGGEARMVEAK